MNTGNSKTNESNKYFDYFSDKLNVNYNLSGLFRVSSEVCVCVCVGWGKTPPCLKLVRTIIEI